MTDQCHVARRAVVLLAAALVAVVAVLTLAASPAVAQVGPAAQTLVVGDCRAAR